MKPLVAYYSRSGTTKKVAETISAALNCDSEEIIDTKNRKGLWGWLTSGRDAVRKRLTVIKETKLDPAGYEIVILGTPDFGSRMAAAVRTYISQNRDRFKQVAFFCTAGGTNVEGLLADMEEFSGKKPLVTLALTTEEVKKGNYEEKAKQFVAGLSR
jgi:flavodoxin